MVVVKVRIFALLLTGKKQKKMKKTFKILGWFILTAILLVVGLVVYVYQTNDMIKAIVNNDESKLYYFPSNEIKEMKLLSFSEKTLIVDDSIKITPINLNKQPKKHELISFLFTEQVVM